MKHSKITNRTDRLLAIDFINTALDNGLQFIHVSDKQISDQYKANRFGISHKRDGKFNGLDVLAIGFDCLGNATVLTKDRSILQLF
jgi:hypothetical protein